MLENRVIGEGETLLVVGARNVCMRSAWLVAEAGRTESIWTRCCCEEEEVGGSMCMLDLRR